MFRVCAVHKFQSRSDPTAARALRLGTKSMQSQPVLIFIDACADYCMNTLSLCFVLIVKERCIAIGHKTQRAELTSTSALGVELWWR